MLDTIFSFSKKNDTGQEADGELSAVRKITVKSCEFYHVDRLISVINGTMDDLGGWDGYIKLGNTVLLKVNLIGPKPVLMK